MVAADHAAVQQMGRDVARKLKLVPTLPDNDASVADCARDGCAHSIDSPGGGFDPLHAVANMLGRFRRE